MMKSNLFKSIFGLLVVTISLASCQKDNQDEVMSEAQKEEELFLNESKEAIAAKLQEIKLFDSEYNNSSARMEGKKQIKTITATAVETPFLRSLVAAVVKTGLAPTLASASLNATVFAPTDRAFAKLPAPFNNPTNIAAITDAGQIEALRQILLYHVLGVEVKKAQIASGRSSAVTLKAAGTSVDNVIYISNQRNLLAINGKSFVTIADIDATNGVIHVIDEVLQFPTQNIAQIAIGSPDGNNGFSALVAALVKTNLAGSFTGRGDFTVFAPTNSAFAKLPAPFNNAANISAITDRAQINALSNILLYHVLSSRNFALDLGVDRSFTTLANAPSNTLRIIGGIDNGQIRGLGNRTPVRITSTNILATNGVIHVIDTVLLPN